MSRAIDRSRELQSRCVCPDNPGHRSRLAYRDRRSTGRRRYDGLARGRRFSRRGVRRGRVGRSRLLHGRPRHGLAGGQGGVPHNGKRAPRRRLRRAARDGLPWKRRRRARGFTPRVRRDDTLLSRGIPAGRAGPARASGAWAIRCELVLRRAKPLPPVQHVQHVGGARPSRRRPRRHARRHGDRRRRHARSAACGGLPQAVDPQGEGITAVESVGRSSPAGPTDHRSRAHGVARGDRRGPRDDECRAGGAASGR